MPVPGSQEIRRPLLDIFKDEKPHNFVINEFVDTAAEKLGVQTDELSAIEKTAFKNNVNDAVSYLLKNKLLSHPSKATYLITRTGLEALGEDGEDSAASEAETPQETAVEESGAEIPAGLDEAAEEISQDPEPEIEKEELPEETAQEETEENGNESESDDVFFDEAADDNESENNNENESGNEDLTMNENEAGQELLEATEEIEEPAGADEEAEEPDLTGLENDEEDDDEAKAETETEFEEAGVESAQDLSRNPSIEEMLEKYNEKLAGSVEDRIESLNQDNFCMLVMDLLSKMGYRAFQNARYTSEAEGSDLIQGIILENKAGMNPIYIHAKKLSRSKTVSKSEMLDFVNAIADKGGKGMFVTVGKFSKSAEDAAKDEGIMLVDGEKLAGLMIANNFCVNTERTFEVKALDDESFGEYEK